MSLPPSAGAEGRSFMIEVWDGLRSRGRGAPHLFPKTCDFTWSTFQSNQAIAEKMDRTVGSWLLTR